MKTSRRLSAAALLAAVAISVVTPSSVHAAKQPEDEIVDARYTGYETQKPNLEPSSTATVYMLMVGLGVLTLGGLFKNAKRTHLD